eukprot:scaffold57197_cov15-Tisochrysis_lutea.AAC.1
MAPPCHCCPCIPLCAHAHPKPSFTIRKDHICLHRTERLLQQQQQQQLQQQGTTVGCGTPSKGGSKAGGPLANKAADPLADKENMVQQRGLIGGHPNTVSEATILRNTKSIASESIVQSRQFDRLLQSPGREASKAKY